MKKLIIALVLTVASSSAFAANAFLVGGFNFTLPTVDAAAGNDYEEEGKFGGMLGIRNDIETGSNLLINFGVDLSYKSIGYNSGSTLQVLKLELPVFFGWKFNDVWSAFGGPKVALTANLSCNGCSALADSDGNEQFTLPVVVGARMMFTERMGGELYYEHATLPVARFNSPKEKFFDSATGFNFIYTL